MYYYAIRAVSLAGMGQWTQHLFPDAMLAAEAPDKPVLTATVDKQSVVLSWTVPAANGAAITGYEIQVTADGPTETTRAWGGAPRCKVVVHSVRQTRLSLQRRTRTATSLQAGPCTIACVQSIALTISRRTCCDIKWSDEVSAKVAPIAPNMPGPVTLTTPNDGDAQVVLTWTLAGTGFDPNDNEPRGHRWCCDHQRRDSALEQRHSPVGRHQDPPGKPGRFRRSADRLHLIASLTLHRHRP